MKTKFMYLGLAAAMLMGLNSCSNDNDGNIDAGETKNVYMKFGNAAPETYTAEAPATTTPITFGSGHIYFVNAAGVIMDYYPITTAATSLTVPKNINLAALTGTGEMITGLPGSVEKVYVVGNTTGLPISGNIATVEASLIAVEDQAPLLNANLYGSNTLTAPLIAGDPYTCTVNVKPAVARIELTDIQAATSVITGFEVEGIFVDNYYSKGTLNGVVAATNLVDNGSNAAAFGHNTTEYPSTLTPSIYDWYSTPLAALANTVSTPTSGYVWGYNVFAGGVMPRIIIKLKNITTSDSSVFPDPQFLTIKGLYNTATSVSLSAIVSGNVYRIATGGFTFDETNLTPLPSLATKDIEVNVTVATWTIIPVTAEL